jgi:hypothetical protein
MAVADGPFSDNAQIGSKYLGLNERDIAPLQDYSLVKLTFSQAVALKPRFSRRHRLERQLLYPR